MGLPRVSSEIEEIPEQLAQEPLELERGRKGCEQARERRTTEQDDAPRRATKHTRIEEDVVSVQVDQAGGIKLESSRDRGRQGVPLHCDTHGPPLREEEEALLARLGGGRRGDDADVAQRNQAEI